MNSARAWRQLIWQYWHVDYNQYPTYLLVPPQRILGTDVIWHDAKPQSNTHTHTHTYYIITCNCTFQPVVCELLDNESLARNWKYLTLTKQSIYMYAPYLHPILEGGRDLPHDWHLFLAFSDSMGSSCYSLTWVHWSRLSAENNRFVSILINCKDNWI